MCHAAHERAIAGGKQQSYDPLSTIAFNIYLASLQRSCSTVSAGAPKAEPGFWDLHGGLRGWQTRIMHMATTTVYGSPHPRIRVLVADDHEVMRLGIRNLLEVQPGWSVCAEANNGQEALEKTVQYHPDVIIMDISMPVMNGLEAASRITKEHPQIPVILFSLHLSDDLYRHFNTEGIRGAVAKGDAARDLVLAVQTVLAGGTFFPGKKSGSN